MDNKFITDFQNDQVDAYLKRQSDDALWNLGLDGSQDLPVTLGAGNPSYQGSFENNDNSGNNPISTNIVNPGNAPQLAITPATPGARGAIKQPGISGRLDQSILSPIGGGFYLRADAANAWIQLRAQALMEGVKFGVVSAYRTYQRQVELKALKGKWAATPGHSNHGWGVALDLDIPRGQVGYNSVKYKWILERGGQFGWVHPSWALPGGSGPPEPWHIEYVH